MQCSCSSMFSFQRFRFAHDALWKVMKQIRQILVRFCDVGGICCWTCCWSCCIICCTICFTTCTFSRWRASIFGRRRRWRQRSTFRRFCIWTFRWRKRRKMMPNHCAQKNKIKQMNWSNKTSLKNIENINGLNKLLGTETHTAVTITNFNRKCSMGSMGVPTVTALPFPRFGIASFGPHYGLAFELVLDNPESRSLCLLFGLFRQSHEEAFQPWCWGQIVSPWWQGGANIQSGFNSSQKFGLKF